jgi:beta-phosphoglucomutase-like phosphatase (HAD superfamily)
VSNAVRETVAAMLDRVGATGFLEFWLSNEDGNAKPAPDLYLLAAARFGVQAAHMIVVEDGDPGIVAATRAGCMVVAVDGPQYVTPALLPRIVAAGRRAAIAAEWVA